jgi:hypothetical protein
MRGRGRVRRVEITFAGGERFVADLLERDAPRCCDTVWANLPFDASAYHGTASGYTLWHPVSFWTGMVEHPRVYGASPGDLLINSQVLPVTMQGGVVIPQEIYIVYGPVAFFNFSGWFPMAHFGRIAGDLDRLREACRRVHRRGQERVTYRRLDQAS